ncbi:GNAT family N-acetyltransferase [Nostoc sp. FACHB-152]|uniref:GNAT family N-acetyltransferase n=1 Tax=unclassified Nostoc TaxID=2593658 RepID=UPI0016827EB7|nr:MULTISPECIES: GNAT family N-acetyltransferase [unclassified Nostoc]MBD2450010.1 GNAT family N-acetyltransferase [Nostoc sp. FACHB-152]MBD2470130.1 GNAT family N-acetyltransferase [Nostoc sp. FACHB-145]
MQIIETFYTKRLFAERLRFIHLNDLDRMHQNKQVMATLGGIRSDDETRLFILNNVHHWEQYGYGLWVFLDKINKQFVGRAGLRTTLVEGKNEVELAYALMAKFWGQGLATEMGEKILRIGFDLLGLQDIVCFTLTTNLASKRVMEKLGFQYERDIIHAGLPHLFYRLIV